MKSATVADLRNNFATVSKWIREGEAVTITRRGVVFATLAPAKRERQAPPWPDRAAWRRSIFPNGPVKSDIQNVLDYDRGDA